MPTCPYLDRRGYDDYHCRATGSTIPYDYWNHFCSEYNYLECVDYKRMNIVNLVQKLCGLIGIGEGSFVYDMIVRFTNYVDTKLSKNNQNYSDIGSILTTKFQSDSESTIVAHNIFNDVFLPVLSDLAINKVDRAINRIMVMVDSLVERYDMNFLVSDFSNNALVYKK